MNASATTATQRWVLGLAALASIMVSLDTLVVTTALTSIHNDLHASSAQLEWTINAFTLSLAVSLATAATLGDRFGRRRMMAFGVALFTLSSAGCALAPTVGWLIAARAVQGVGAAFTFALTIAIVGATFGPQRRGAALGLLQGLTGLATAGGPIIGGAIAQGLDWRFVFWVNIPLGVAAVPLIVTRIPESRGGAGRLDPAGVGLLTAGLIAIVWPLVRGNDAGWGSAEVVGALVVGVALIGAFVAWERRAPAPMLPLRLYRSRSFAAGNVASFAMYGSLFAAVYFVAQFLQSGLGYSPLAAGVRMLPWTLTLLIVAPFAGRLADRHGPRRYVIAGLTAQAVGMAWLALIASPTVAYAALVPGMVLAGAGLSLAMPGAQAAVLQTIAPNDMGAAAGTNSTVRQVGAVFGIAVAVAVFSSIGGYASASDFSDGFAGAVAVAAALGLAGALAGTWLPRRARRGALEAVAEPEPA
jgi:EmrB/QacA subfamily drug resistance transporter